IAVIFAGSANGRPPHSGCGNLGSSPSPAAKLQRSRILLPDLDREGAGEDTFPCWRAGKAVENRGFLRASLRAGSCPAANSCEVISHETRRLAKSPKAI